MKILHIIAGAAHGGAETFCLDAIKSLHEQGVEQHVICRAHPDFTKALDERHIPYKTITFSRFLKPLEQRVINKAVKTYAPDLVHSWMSRASSFVPKGIKQPVLGWFGGYYNLKNYKNADYYMGVTKDIVRHIKENITDQTRAYVVHTFGTLAEDKPIAKSDFGLDDNAKTVLMLSRMHWKKGVDTLLEAGKKIPNLHLLIAGDGPDLEKYKTLAKSIGMEQNAHFLGWRDDRAALLSISDVCALPSRYEPFGTVIAESWYAKVPLVATRADGAKQYVEHGENGLLSDIDDVDTLAENIKTALKDDALREKIIKGGTETYNTLFSKDVVTQSLIDAYEEMIKRGKV